MTIYDVGGLLAFTQPMIEEYVAENSDVISGVTFQQAPSADLAGLLQAQQDSDNLSIDLVLSGSDAIGAGIVNDLWDPISEHEDAIPGIGSYTEEARSIYETYDGNALVVATEYTGPLLEWNPDAVADPPQTAEELLAWAKANPGRFTYSQPPSSGPGRQFLMGLPYILDDVDPSDPENGWENTWAYLAELDQYVAAYPSSTGSTFENLARGGIDMMASSAGWDIGQRQQGAIPLEFEVGTIDDWTWIQAGHFAAIPAGLEPERREVVIGLLNGMMSESFQVGIFAAQDKAIPGPAIEGVSLEDAPAEVQEAVAEFNRPQYLELFEAAPSAVELPPETMSVMFDRWEREIGN
ncbi:MAG: extracellular solute-binding protein [Actinomycetota bacterium]|nr:extracellular solute-binding protein [Actinomycetota bacterium]